MSGPGDPVPARYAITYVALFSSARFAVVWPRTSRKSVSLIPRRTAPRVRHGRQKFFRPRDQCDHSARCRMPNTRTPSTAAASAAFSAGTIRLAIPCLRAQTAMERARRVSAGWLHRAKVRPPANDGPSSTLRPSRPECRAPSADRIPRPLYAHSP